VYFSILNDPEKELKEVQVAIKTIKSKHDCVYDQFLKLELMNAESVCQYAIAQEKLMWKLD